MLGASFTAFTVNVNVCVACRLGVPLSTTVTVISVVPLAFASGVAVAVQFGNVPPNTILAFGTKLVFVLVADKFADVQSNVLSWSAISKVTLAALSSFTVALAIGVIVGASFTGLTVTLNVETAVKAGTGVPVSVNVNAICTGPPFCPAAGVTVTVQFGAVPATTIFAFGIIVVFEDATDIPVEQLTVESISLIVKANAEVALSSLTV